MFTENHAPSKITGICHLLKMLIPTQNDRDINPLYENKNVKHVHKKQPI